MKEASKRRKQSDAATKTEIADIRADLMDEIGFVDGRVEDLNEQVEFLTDEVDRLQWMISAKFYQESKMASPSPTFVCVFSDGVTIRMTANCGEKGAVFDHVAKMKLDLPRGIHLAQAAYESRKKKPPPALLKAHFESAPNGDKGKILRIYTAAELNAAPR